MKKNDTPFLDRVFLHSKNADERLFDMILRIITFIVLIIILWLYADIAHAKADTLDLSAYILGSNEYNLNGYWFNDDYVRISQIFSDIPYNSNYQLPTTLWKNMKVTSEMDFDNNQFVIGCNSGYGGFESIFLILIPKDIDVALLNTQQLYFMDDCDCLRVWTDFSHQNDSSYYTYSTVSFSAGLVDFSSSNQLSSGALSFFFGNIPYLKGSNVSAPTYFANGNDLYTCYNANYFMYDDLAKLPNSDDVESSKNHLAISDCQIGLTALDKEITDFDESSVVIGVAVEDNWILSHMNDYSVLISYNFYLRDSHGILSWSDPETMYNQVYPLSAFKTEPVMNGMANIMQNSMIAPFPSNRNFYDYYHSLYSSYQQRVVSERKFNYDGIIPTLVEHYFNTLIGSYTVTTPNQPSNTIYEFYLDVSVTLSAGNGDNGGTYTKRFDFKRGQTSILNADAYHNPNPWQGESNPLIEYDPEVPSVGGGGGSPSAYGGNTSVVVNNNGGKVPINVHNQSQLDDCIRRYNEVRQVFFADIQAIAEDTGSNNFIRVLNEAMPQIPGMSIYMTYVSLICFVALILIVLKVLLF